MTQTEYAIIQKDHSPHLRWVVYDEGTGKIYYRFGIKHMALSHAHRLRNMYGINANYKANNGGETCE